MKKKIHRVYLGLKFRKIDKIYPKKEKGKIITYKPQKNINTKLHPLNKYGKGAFCYFAILPDWQEKAGLYIFIISNKEKYVGECDDLFNRMYDYGHISRYKCFKYGQSTNCKINKLLLKSFERGSVELWFHQTRKMSRVKRKKIERKLIDYLNPRWNGAM